MPLPLTLQSRVGRRIAMLFVVSALLPILALGLLGYFQVRSQLLGQAEAQLALSAKSVGMNVIDQLRLAGQLLEGTDTTRHVALADQLERRPSAAGVSHQLEVVSETGADSGSAGIWLTVRSGTLRARLRPEHLFRSARDRATVGMAEADLCVRDVQTGLLLFCDRGEQPGPFTSASWDLFLAYDYGAPPWRIQLSLPRATVLAPVLLFRRTLLATLVLVLGLVVVLSSVQVRRSLEPLHALREGTRRLADHDFSEPVRVTSGDEFQELAESFNGMSGDLDRQFKDNARLIASLNEMSWGALGALARTVDASSPWTAGHSERVTTLSLRIGERLSLSREDSETLHRGGLLHDIGKIGIPPEILDKPGRLEPRELERIRQHPSMGAKILAPLAAFSDAVPIVLYHHEKFDGTGYPEQLAGYDIPRLARLLAVADVYDALVSQRPYRDGWQHETAVAEIQRCRHTHFDPEIVDAFMDVMEKEGDAARFRLAAVMTA